MNLINKHNCVNNLLMKTNALLFVNSSKPFDLSLFISPSAQISFPT